MKISEANLSFNANNTPTSSDFDDVYFSNENGVQETDYVFIAANQLYERWATWEHEVFNIAETGFGTGLNFFRALQLFKTFRAHYPLHVLTRLHFTSFEKYPLAKHDAQKVIALYDEQSIFDSKFDFLPVEKRPDLSAISSELTQWLSRYPIAIKGIQRREFHIVHPNQDLKQSVTLDLHYGDAIESMTQIRTLRQGLIDAWFLDGFAPSKNDSLWNPALFSQMARISKQDCSFATFTAAGSVKRGLIDAGFAVNKQKGFGRKREMLLGKLIQRSEETAHPPYFYRHGMSEHLNKDSKIAVVGSGLAGAIMAEKLTSRGHMVELIWPHKAPADAASGNPIGGFYPQLNAQQNIASQIQIHSFLYAKDYYQQLLYSEHFDHQWCGALQLAFNDNTESRLAKLLQHDIWPQEIARLVTPSEATNIAKIDMPYKALYLPQAGWISPPSLVNACLRKAQSTGKLSITANTRLLKYDANDAGTVDLTLSTQSSEYSSRYSALVLACGSEMPDFAEPLIPFRITRGQVEMHKTMDDMSSLSTLLCHKGYLTPAHQGFHAMGSTYVKNDRSTQTRRSETSANYEMHIECLKKTNWRDSISNRQEGSYSRAALRCSTPDHLPVVGAMPSKIQLEELKDLYKALPLHYYPIPSAQKNVFVLSGLGSRGLTTAPLMAELLLSQLSGRSLPMPQTLADSLMPNRFIVRSLIRRSDSI